MYQLDQFSPEQRQLLVMLPYRTGLFISLSDATGGGESDAAERQALESIVTSFAEDFLKSEFTEQIMRRTLAEKAAWPSWEHNIHNVPDECRQGCNLLADRIAPRDLGAFKDNLLEIATSVAMAFQEFDFEQASLWERLRMSGGFRLHCFSAKLQRRSAPSLMEYVSISPAERAALARIQDALDSVEPSEARAA